MRRFFLLAGFLGALGLAAAAQDAPATQVAAAAQDAPAGIDQMMAAANTKYLHRDYAASRALYDQARQLIEQEPTDDPRRLEVLQRLTTVASAAGDYAAANTYLGTAIQWRMDRVGPDDLQVIADRLRQVGIYRAMGDDVSALAVLEVVMAKHFDSGGRRDPALAGDQSLMGQIHLEMRKKEDAARDFEAAISLRGLNAAPLDVTLVPDLDRLGSVCIDADVRRYEEAEAVFRQALLIRESVLGSEHADLLATLDGLAYAYFGQKKYEEAEPVYQRLVALWTKSVGESHPMLAIALDKLAVFYIAQQKFDQAHEAYEHANAIRSLFLATGLSKEALESASAGDVPGAIALSRRALHTLDTPNPLYDALREQLSRNVGPDDEAAPKAAMKNAQKSATKK